MARAQSSVLPQLGEGEFAECVDVSRELVVNAFGEPVLALHPGDMLCSKRGAEKLKEVLNTLSLELANSAVRIDELRKLNLIIDKRVRDELKITIDAKDARIAELEDIVISGALPEKSLWDKHGDIMSLGAGALGAALLVSPFLLKDTDFTTKASMAGAGILIIGGTAAVSLFVE